MGFENECELSGNGCYNINGLTGIEMKEMEKKW